jgi:hypothetical protein
MLHEMTALGQSFAESTANVSLLPNRRVMVFLFVPGVSVELAHSPAVVKSHQKVSRPLAFVTEVSAMIQGG